MRWKRVEASLLVVVTRDWRPFDPSFGMPRFEAPAQSAQIQRVLAIPSKRHTRMLVNFLTRTEVEALLDAPSQRTWSGRRDHALILLAVQTGLRLSEITGLERQDLVLGTGAHLRVIGKGRKERCIPLTKQMVAVLKAWLLEPAKGDARTLFPNARGTRLSADGVQYILSKHIATACEACSSLKSKRVTPHVLRHTTAMELLQAGVGSGNDRTLAWSRISGNNANVSSREFCIHGRNLGQNYHARRKAKPLSS